MLTPIVIVTTVSSFLLFLVHIILYREFKHPALRYWTLSWGFYTVRFLFDLASILHPWPWWSLLLQLSVVVSGLFLFQGVYWYLQPTKPFPLGWILFATLALGGVLVGRFLPVPPLVPVLVSFLFLGISNLVMGWYFLQNRSIPRLERIFLGGILIVWGIHKLDYPFLRPFPEFAVWGYTLGSILGMATGLGLLLVFLSSERRRAETSEARFRTLVDSLDDVFFTLDKEGRHTGVFGRWLEQVPGGAAKYLGKTATEILGKEAGAIHLEMALKVFQENKGLTYDWEIPSPEGKRYFQTTLCPVRDETGACIEVVGIGREVTSLKRSLEEVQSRLEEKNVLLREIQHRVQNNLQVILSLLNLQLQSASSEETREAFKVATSRIHTFSDLYTQLQDSENAASIRMDRFLVSLLARAMDSGALQERPELHVETEELVLPLDTALTVGLILNELVSGCIVKPASSAQEPDHARRCGIRVSLKRQEEDLEFILTCDEGQPGVPGISLQYSLCAAHDPLRKELVQSLVMHLNGTVEYKESQVVVRVPVF